MDGTIKREEDVAIQREMGAKKAKVEVLVLD